MYVQRVVTGVSGTAGSLQALRFAAEMARRNGAVLMPVMAWTPPGGELADRRYPCAALRDLWETSARDRLCRAVELAIGGPPLDLGFDTRVVKGEAGRVLIHVADGAGDVLVIGAGRRGTGRRLLTCSVARFCVAHATCPVVAIPPSRLAAELHGLHGWMLRHRMHLDDAELGAAA